MRKRAKISNPTPQQHPALETAIATYHIGRSDGLCHDGAWECAVDALRLALHDDPRQYAQLLTQLKIDLQ